jgi:hypothetical protein
LLSNLCKSVEILYDMFLRLCATDRSSAAWSPGEQSLNMALAFFEMELAQAMASMHRVQLDTPEKEIVAGGLHSLVECWTRLRPADQQPAEAERLLGALVEVATGLRSAVDNVPASHLLEALEHPVPPPWRPDRPESPPLGKRGQQPRHDVFYAEAEKMLQAEPRPTHKEVLAHLRRQFPSHHFFKNKSEAAQQAAFRAGLSRRRRKRSP